jgi:hypothetical protein
VEDMFIKTVYDIHTASRARSKFARDGTVREAQKAVGIGLHATTGSVQCAITHGGVARNGAVGQ